MKSALKIQLGLFYLFSEISTLTDSFNCDRCDDANLCDTVTGTFWTTQLGRGYHPVVTVPRGACGINITELARSNNVLALKDVVRDEYILNGLWKMDGPGKYEGAGVTFIYRRSGQSCPGECLSAHNPILSPVLVQLLYHDRNPGVFYSYKIPKHLTPISRPSHTLDRSELRETAIGQRTIPDSEEEEREEIKYPVFPPRVPIPGPGGVRHRGPIFSSDFTHRRRNSQDRSRDSRRDDQRRRQSLTDITFSRGENDDTIRLESATDRHIETGDSMLSVFKEYKWILSQSQCSRPCGGGIKETVYVCVSTITQDTVDDSYCDNSTRPESHYDVCNEEACTPQWSTGEWSVCSATCGEGTQAREVTCKQRISPTYTQVLDDSFCTSRKPAQQRLCYSESCYTWFQGDWTECPATCGAGVRHRRVQCRDETGTEVDKTLCGQPSPVTEEACNTESCHIETQWYFSQWNGKCSEVCGTRAITRRVHCATSTGQILPDIRCDGINKPPGDKDCRTNMCGAKWFSGPWSKCSQTCGSGIKTRHVFCTVNIGSRLEVSAENNCRVEDKPRERKKCSEEDCGYTWYTTEWSACSASCGTGVSTRLVKCYDDKMEPASLCPEKIKPVDSQACYIAPCWEPDPDCVLRHCGPDAHKRKCRFPHISGCCIPCLYQKLRRTRW